MQFGKFYEIKGLSLPSHMDYFVTKFKNHELFSISCIQRNIIWSDVSASAKFSSFDADELSRFKDFILIGAGNFTHFSWTYIDEHISLKVCFQYNYRLHFSDNLHAFVDYFSSVNCVAFFLFQAVYMLMALSLARDEFHWLLRHADNNVPTRKANTKTHSEDFVDR